jgi:hypothetical protein
MKPIIVFLFCCIYLQSRSQDSAFIRVHFLYGSKPLARYKHTEPKWFGGTLGGHAGIEEDSDRVINFQPHGSFHWFVHKNDRHSNYVVNTVRDFYAIMDGRPDSVKRLVITIPVSMEQKKKLDSIARSYLQQTPYDYALFGMRCGAAAYELLGQLGVVKRYSCSRTWRKILYPKKLRKRLLAKAAKNGWKTERQNGSTKRKWERD